ncbi:uncharacterized protein I206_100303 [Kwoniella pini CBS 10737]|uniref:Uncharacterized protein n=1 Tax=Kwoniella pini CBS 10737 TaxID=1296096 RepID=A0A1B9IDU3_9TREE|nr:uncharacterized protein I206_01022 [Kwoniella pini CBS 10737]OCF53716.1 hypothetical protein I206_01022 [Kwoniella pini CBS 10737]
MDLSESGLPTSFGKQSAPLPTKPPSLHTQSHRGTRGGSRGRGRGGDSSANGRGRGGGRGGSVPGKSDSGYGQRIGGQTDIDGLAGGIKRPHPPSPNDPSSSSCYNSGFRQNQQYSDRGGRGGRGRGGGLRSQQGNGHAVGDKGFWKDSFLEDPWKDLEAQRARQSGTV